MAICKLTCAATDFLTKRNLNSAVAGVDFVRVQAVALNKSTVRGAKVFQKDRLRQLVRHKAQYGKATDLLSKTRKPYRNWHAV